MTNGFGKKCAIWPCFKTTKDYKKQEVKKIEKLGFFQRG